MATAKLDKHELKQPDEFVSWGTHAAHFAANHALQVLGGVVVSLLLIATAFGWWHSRGERELEAASKLFVGEKKMEDPMRQFQQFQIPGLLERNPAELEGAIAEFEKVAQEYPGTKTARRAKRLSGDAYLKLKKWDEAATAYEQANGGLPIEQYYALNGLAHALEAKAAFDDAAAAYRRITTVESMPFRDIATIDLARALESAGKKEDAKKVLSTFAIDFKDSAAKTRAETKLAALGGTPVPTGGGAIDTPVAPAPVPGSP